VTVGSTLQHAVFRAVYAETNAAVQRDAIALGGVTYLSEEECVAADAANSSQAGRAWELWVRDLKG
jgi:ribulose-5-phosphate 4-epimerase/fuculose-1-phosphate aldolase